MIESDCAASIQFVILKPRNNSWKELLDVHVESRPVGVDVGPLSVGVEELEILKQMDGNDF